MSGSWPEFPNTIETSSLKRLARFELTVGNKSLHKRDGWENVNADDAERKDIKWLTCKCYIKGKKTMLHIFNTCKFAGTPYVTTA